MGGWTIHMYKCHRCFNGWSPYDGGVCVGCAVANPMRYSALDVFVAPDDKRLCPGCRVTERKETDWIMCQRCVNAMCILAMGLRALMSPRCARCEKRLRPAEADHATLGNHWCDDCWSHVHNTGEDEWYPEGATTGNDKPRLLPRPGTIVLAVDDPCGDDVAEG